MPDNQSQDPRVSDLFKEELYICTQLRTLVDSPPTFDDKDHIVFLWARQWVVTHRNLMKLSGGNIEINW